MNKKTLISSLIMTTAMGMSSATSAAALTPGVLGDTWYETQIKQTLQRVIHKPEDGVPSTWDVRKNFKIDTGKKNCYTHLIVNPQSLIVDDYLGEVFCFFGNTWTHQSTFQVFDLADGNVGNESGVVDPNFELGTVITLPALGTTLSQPAPHNISFLGTLIIQPKLNKSSALTSVKAVTPKAGLTDYHEFVTPRVQNQSSETIEGQDHANLRFIWVKNPAKIANSNDLFACATSWETGNNPKLGCIKPPQ